MLIRLYIPVLENIYMWGWGIQENYFSKVHWKFHVYALFNN